MKKLIKSIIAELTAGRDGVLCTVVASSGSTPRGAGARMLVNGGGRVCGTIGGGAVEYRATQMAQELIGERRSGEHAFVLNRSDVEHLGMICGGDVRVFFQYIAAGDSEFLSLMRELLRRIDACEDVWLVTDITDEAAPKTYVIGAEAEGLPAGAADELARQRSVRRTVDGRDFYSEPVSRSGKVYIFGGGHVAQELVPVISHIGFNCVVIDDRPEFASRDLFPQAADVRAGDFENIDGCTDIGENDYVIVMTRGHAFDYAIQEQVLRKKTRYVGVIGSKHKIAAVSEKLRAAGVTQEAIDSVYTPIGVDIMAETPAEIAISIAAELILVRAGSDGK